MRKKTRPKARKTFKSSLPLFIFLASFLLIMLGFSFVKKFSKSFCANSISCIKDLSGQYEPGDYGQFQGRTVIPPPKLSQIPRELSQVLGEVTDKRIYIDLSTQRLQAFEGNDLVFEFPVSTGKWALTPTGEFKTWIKLRYTRMAGGNQALGTYYNLPNVPHTMYFYNAQHPKTQGFGLHGAYWHNNFGHPMSHGCVNISLPDAEKLFNWAPLGISVTISGQTPEE